MGAWECAVAWGDYDNDGDLDILLSGHTTKIYDNQNGIFSENANIQLPQLQKSSVAWGDYDADGYLDILLSGLQFTPPIIKCVTKVFRNDQSGNFEDIHAPIDSVQNGSVAWGDIDNDGYLDIILNGNNEALGSKPHAKIYRYSNGSYESIFTYLTGVLNSSIDLGDYDGDGKLDFVQTGEDDFGNSVCEIYHDVHSGFNSIPEAPSGLSSLINNSTVTLSWQPGHDSNTPDDGLTYNLRVGTTHGGSEIMSAMAQTDGTRKIARLGNTNHLTSWQIRNPLPAEKYYWSVQTIDNVFAGSAFAAEDSFSMDLYSQTYYQSGINGLIGDMQAVMDTINVNIGGEMLPQYQLVDVHVLIDSIQHTATGDLEITLIHNGLEDTLVHQVGGDGDNFFHTRLADTASIPLSSGNPPFTGVFQPYQALALYQGMDPNGEWILKVYDTVTGNTGTLDAWGLTLVFEMMTGIDDPLSTVPTEYQLYQNYPNPFNPATHIKFDLPKTGKVNILIYNVLGQKVETLVDKDLPAGRYNYLWKPRGLASGLYFYRIQAEGFHDVKKMILMK
jgi:subtilisin-like proprotein convertase family protein